MENEKIQYLSQYVRDRKGNPRGIVLATVVNDNINLGWSYTNTKAGDRFDKYKAYKIAWGRAQHGAIKSGSSTIPHSVMKVMDKMSVRATRYFKNQKPYHPFVKNFV